MVIVKSLRRTPLPLLCLNIFRSPLIAPIVPSDAFAAPREKRGALRQRPRSAAGAIRARPLVAAAAGDHSMWDPVSQTYTGGAVPSQDSARDLDELLAANGGRLKIFGYGSLCWHPGTDGVLSRASLPDNNGSPGVADDAHGSGRQVTTAPGRVLGYQRCWCQRSADHRGTPDFNGIVCTLLSDAEAGRLYPGAAGSSATEGLIYTVGAELVGECLAELDFREKGVRRRGVAGEARSLLRPAARLPRRAAHRRPPSSRLFSQGYARDVIDVVEDGTGRTVKALLYRGTPDNPAFWGRALADPPLAAGESPPRLRLFAASRRRATPPAHPPSSPAVISVAAGPSGPNDAYLFRLEAFLGSAAARRPSRPPGAGAGDARTGELAALVQRFRTEARPYFLCGSGSNEHGQLLLGRSTECSGARGQGEI